MLREMRVLGLTREETKKAWIVILGSEDPSELLPIWIGTAEAQAIGIGLEGVEFPRPLTHDLLRATIQLLGGELRRVVVSALRDSTFYAFLEIEREGSVLRVDARPSDAIALAVRFRAPIFVDEEVLSEARTESGDDGEERDEDQLRSWLEDLKPEDFGKYEM